jgi:riboflavin biosynthesis pyrimidine reductase
MRQLLPTPADEVDLASAYAYPTELREGCWVRANMVSSVDGAATVDGKAGGLSGTTDQQLFALLRGLSDAVVVGAGTARIEGYRALSAKDVYAAPRAALSQRLAPVLVVVSARLELDPESKLFHGGAERTIVVTPASSPADRRALLAEVADVVVAGDEQLDVPSAVGALVERGLTRILCEGGPTLLADVAAAGRLDELCLTIAPRLVGGESRRILSGSQADDSLELAHLLEDDGTLFTRYARPRTEHHTQE